MDYGTDGSLLTAQTWNYLTMCPPPGVGHSGGASGAPYDVGDRYLTSEMDRNNPVMVCDPRVTQTDQYQVDGAAGPSNYTTNGTVLHTWTTYSYDGADQGSSHISGYDYGNVDTVNMTANDVNSEHYIANTIYYPNDSAGVYLTDLPGRTTTINASGAQYGCHVTFYGGCSALIQGERIFKLVVLVS